MKRYCLIGIMIAAVISALASSALGADPIIGSWKLNPVKSRFALNSPVDRQQSEFYREMKSDQIELTYTGLDKDGKPHLWGQSKVLVIAWPSQGGFVKALQGDPGGQIWVETQVAPGDWYMTAIRDGRQFATRHKFISKDGRTMLQNIRGIDAQGRVWEDQLVFDKQ